MKTFKVTQIPISQFKAYQLRHSYSTRLAYKLKHINYKQLCTNVIKHIKNFRFTKQDFAISIILILALSLVHMKDEKVSTIAANTEHARVIRKINTHPSMKAHVSINKKRDFIHQFAFLAEQQQDDSNISPSIVIAQAAIESQWGKSILYRNDNNPFGMKGTYYGKDAVYETTEVVNGSKETVKAPFKKYPSVRDSIIDHDIFLRRIFQKEHAKKDDYVSEAKALQKGGYATDPNYARKIMNFIKENNLVIFD